MASVQQHVPPTAGSSDLPSPPAGGLLDLEKELSCSICTDILYQPLTLLDCLHTFCGSCLKEWFGFQRNKTDHENARSGHRPKPYVFTCPSCRAVVRETRPNATVTTLLDMYMQANPDRARSAKDREEIAKTYKPGEAVLPAQEAERSNERARETGLDPEEEAERRMIEHARELSLREINGTAQRERHTERRRRDYDQRPRQERERTDGRHVRGQNGASRQQEAPPAGQSSQIGHQSSLRSLLGSHSEEMKEEILRQIAEEGLLDGIDLENIEVEQEDEISERIAEAYRRRKRERSRAQNGSPHGQPSGVSNRSERPRDTAASNQPRETTSRPPASRPHLFGAVDNPPRPRVRSSSQAGSSSLRPDSRESGAQHASRSATDLSDAPRTEDHHNPQPRRRSHETRRSTDPPGVPVSEQWRRAATGTAVQGRPLGPSDRQAPSQIAPEVRADATSERVQSPSGRADQLPEPLPQTTVSCDRCGRPHIEREVHYTCDRCRPGSTFDLCTRCYRLGKGCLHWFGFGFAAWPRFEKEAPPGSEPPHILQSQRYIEGSAEDVSDVPRTNATGNVGPSQASPTSTGLALEQGVFCDICRANANNCYWHCEVCNDGEWGYCGNCVNTAHHCPHPLLSLQLYRDGDQQNPPSPSPSNLFPANFPLTCNNCRQEIHPTARRIHCPNCENGDYDLCMPCYRSMHNDGTIRAHDWLNGWRRCPRGHRTQLVEFEPRPGGQLWRRVVDDVVGGWSLDMDNEPPASFVPASSNGNGVVEGHKKRGRWSWRVSADGQAMGYKDSAPQETVDPVVARRQMQQQQAEHGRVVAGWAWMPEQGVKDELAFPRGAVIEEVRNINGDFYEGVYCRSKGLFPSAYVRPVS